MREARGDVAIAGREHEAHCAVLDRDHLIGEHVLHPVHDRESGHHRGHRPRVRGQRYPAPEPWYLLPENGLGRERRIRIEPHPGPDEHRGRVLALQERFEVGDRVASPRDDYRIEVGRDILGIEPLEVAWAAVCGHPEEDAGIGIGRAHLHGCAFYR